MESNTAATKPKPLEMPAGHPKASIFIVDDEPVTCRLLGRALQELGYETTACTNAHEALTLISSSRCDVVVLDFEMPELNGAEWCAALRSMPGESATIPVIMLTAYSGEREEIACLDAGANDFVSKPVSLAVLRARIETQLRLSALNSQLQQQNSALEQWRVERERDLEAAQLTQRALLPVDVPVLAGWNGAAIYQPLIYVGGDVFGWEPLKKGGWLVWIADATGHGAAAALLTTLARTLFHQASERLGDDPAAVLTKVNRQLHEVFRGGSFMTAACVALHPGSGKVRVSSAGHPPLALVRQHGEIEWTTEGGPLLGLQPGSAYPVETVQLKRGDTLLLYTDGLHSAPLATDARPGHLDLAPHLLPNPQATVFLQNLLTAVEGDAENSFTDDVAAIAWTREG